jgi:hypothetical protein
VLTHSRDADPSTPEEGSRQSVNTRRRGRPRVGRSLRPAVLVSLALTLLGICWLAFGHDDEGGNPSSHRSASRAASSNAHPAGPRSSTVDTDPRRQMFDSGLPDPATTAPAPALSGLDAYVTDSRAFVTEVHNAANSYIAGVDLPQALIDDQVRQLAVWLADLDARTATVDGATAIGAATHDYAPVIDALRSRALTPAAVIDMLREAQSKWQQAAAAANPKLDRSLPVIASISAPTPPEAPRSPAAQAH